MHYKQTIMSRNFLFTLVTFFFISGLLCQSFPQRCEGTWTGNMEIWSNGKLINSVDVKLEIYPLQGEEKQWTWKTSYYINEVQDTAHAKDYIMIEKDAETGLYLLDEGDGIVLTCYAFSDKLYSTFLVDRAMLTGNYELRGEQLIFEVTSGQKLKGKKQDVLSYSTSVVQRVVFTKSP